MLSFASRATRLFAYAIGLWSLVCASAQAQGGSGACTHFVNRQGGSDSNDGRTAGDAWASISRANKYEDPAPQGAVVCIAPGTYYEAVQPRSSNVTYRALNGAGRYDVVVSGLDPVPLGAATGEPGWEDQGGGLWRWMWRPRPGWETDPGTFPNGDEDPDPLHRYFHPYRIAPAGPWNVQRREFLVANTGAPAVGAGAQGRFEGHVMYSAPSLASLNSTYRNYSNPQYGVYGAFFVDTLAAGPYAYGRMSRPVAIYARFWGPGTTNSTPSQAMPRMSVRRAGFLPRTTTGAEGNVDLCGAANTEGGFTVEGITFRHTNALIQRGAMCPGRANSVFRNVVAEFNNAAGINTGFHGVTSQDNPTVGDDQAGRDHRFIGVRTSYNGQIGFRGECDRCLIEDSEFSYNNWKDTNYGWEAGGSKFSFSRETIIRRVRAFQNNGPGIWFDTANQDNVIEGSWADQNVLAGIFLELFTVRTLVQHNISTGTRRTRPNGYPRPGFINDANGAGFLIQAAPDNYLFHNSSVNNQGAGYYFNITSEVNVGRQFGYDFPWTGSHAQMINNVAVGNALATRPGDENPLSFATDAREVEIQDLDQPKARANTFAGNLYLGHDDPAEDVLHHQGFALFDTTYSGPAEARTANTNLGWKALLDIAPGSENYDERVLTYNATAFRNLAAPSAWPNWPTTMNMGGAPLKPGLPAIPAGTVPNRRQGYCYGWNGANPEAVLGSFYLDNPAPSGCPQNSENAIYITTNTTLTASNSASYAGKEIYVSDNVTLTISGTFTLRAAGTQPSRLNLNGRLVGSGTIAVEGGSELVIRPLANTSGFTGSIPLTGAGSCLMVQEGARFDLAPNQSITASNGALIAVRGGTISLGAGARLTMRASAAPAQIAPGSRFEMGQNARIEFLNPVQIVGTAAAPVVFERAGGAAWAGVTVAGAGSHLDQVALSGGTSNLTVTGSNTVVEHVVSTGASVAALVVRTPAVRQEPTASPGLTAPRETNGVVVRDGRFAGSAIGVQVHQASGIALSRNAVEGNGFGVSLVNATVSTFRRNVVTASGTYGLYLSGTSNLGVGPEEAASSAAPSGCSAGLNRITGSGSAEIMAESGSAFGLGQNGFAGTLGGYNEISDAAGVLVWTGDKRGSTAEYTWWGGPLDPTRIVGSVSTDYALSFNPTAGSGTVLACATASEVLADAQTRLEALPVTAEHEAAVRDLLVPALDADPAVQGAARALLATWAQPAGDVASDPVLAATATAAGITTARVDLADDDATAAQAALDAAPEPSRDEVRVERYRMTAAVAEADERFADALTALDAADAIVLPAPPMDAGKRSAGPTVDPQRAALAAAAAAAQVRTTEAPAADAARTEAAPTALRVLAPWPNPSRGSVTVAIEVPVAGALRVEVFDVLGRSVAVLHDGWAQPGRVEARLGAGPLAAGSYVVRATLGNAAPQTSRFVVVR